jgi:hypothetical protein
MIAALHVGNRMPKDQGLVARITRLLGTLDDQDQAGPRLAADARRLWQRVERFIDMGLSGRHVDAGPLEFACYALQLPVGKTKSRPHLKQRCQQAAELMVSLLGDDIEEKTLDRVGRILTETAQKSPMLDEARLLADAVNLDDFGVAALFSYAIQLGLSGGGVMDVAAALNKREQYGYWEARLKDGFHFEPVAVIARRRLEHARQVSALLHAELAEDQPHEKP